MRITQIVRVNGRAEYRSLSDAKVRRIFEYRKKHSVKETAERFNYSPIKIYNMKSRFEKLGLNVSEIGLIPSADFVPAPKLHYTPAGIEMLVNELKAKATALRERADAIDKIIAELPTLITV